MPLQKKIAFVTSSEFARLTEDDRIAAAALERTGIRVEPAIWDSPSVDWKSFDLVIMRSCWDYFHKPEEFVAWLHKMKSSDIPLRNSVDVILPNMNKSYLKELYRKGFTIPATLWIEQQSNTTLAETLSQSEWTKSVIKPTISGSAFETWIVDTTPTPEDEIRFRNLNAKYGVMVQQFMDEVTSTGEWSLIFFDKKYSHTVLKRAKDNDFRVQSDFGGTVHSTAPPPKFIEQASAIVNSITEELLYARVDGVNVNGKLVLMELELTEPALFFHADPSAPVRFTESIKQRLGV